MAIADALRDNPLTSSEREIMNTVRLHEPISRAALVGNTTLAQPSVHRNSESLIARGLLHVGVPDRGLRGQPSPKLSLAREAIYSLGVSVNTDSVVVALADMGCTVVEEVRLRTPPLSRASTLSAIRDLMQRLITRHQVAREQVVGVGVGIAGFLLPGGRQVNSPEPLQDWSLVDLPPLLEEALGYRVRLENNGRAGAVGESLNGVGRQVRSFCYLSMNHGFGGGIILDGQLWRGINGNAGEFSGCLTPEEGLHRPALRYLVDLLRAKGVAVDSIEDLRLRFDPHWPGVEEWVDSVVPQLDRVINTLSAIIDPEVIVLGGQAPPALACMLIERLQFWDRNPRYGVGQVRPRLMPSESNVDAAAAGAAALMIKSLIYA